MKQIKIFAITVLMSSAISSIAQEDKKGKQTDFGNDISLSFTNFSGNNRYDDLYNNFNNNGQGPAIIYRRWNTKGFALKVGIGSQFLNNGRSEFIYVDRDKSYMNVQDKESKYYYFLLGFEYKKQVLRNLALYYGAHLQIGYQEVDYLHINSEVSNNTYQSNTLLYDKSHQEGVLLKLTPVAGIKYQILKRFEIGGELRYLGLSALSSTTTYENPNITPYGNDYPEFEFSKDINANLYLTYRFGKR